MRFTRHGRPYSACYFQTASTVGNILDFVGIECFLDSHTFHVSLAGGQANRKLYEVFPKASEVTLNIVTVEDCAVDVTQREHGEVKKEPTELGKGPARKKKLLCLYMLQFVFKLSDGSLVYRECQVVTTALSKEKWSSNYSNFGYRNFYKLALCNKPIKSEIHRGLGNVVNCRRMSIYRC